MLQSNPDPGPDDRRKRTVGQVVRRKMARTVVKTIVRSWNRSLRGKPVPPPVLVQFDVTIAGLDARHDGVRIAHLSDIHVGNMTPQAHIRAAIELANDAQPDVIALTGDYVCWRRHEVELARVQLAGLRAPRVFAVLGNHDYFTWGAGMSDALTDNGYEVLRNESKAIDINGSPLHVVGVDDPVTHHHDLDASFAGLPVAAPKIVLCHSPDQSHALAPYGADLILSGHTHGGQLFVPGLTDRLMRRVGLHHRRGMYAIDERTQLYVTPGVGFSGVTQRFGEGTVAEVALITLRKG